MIRVRFRPKSTVKHEKDRKAEKLGRNFWSMILRVGLVDLKLVTLRDARVGIGSPSL